MTPSEIVVINLCALVLAVVWWERQAWLHRWLADRPLLMHAVGVSFVVAVFALGVAVLESWPTAVYVAIALQAAGLGAMVWVGRHNLVERLRRWRRRADR